MDTARTVKRLGADEALIVYQRDRAHMPAHAFEADEALEEGVKIKWLTSIKEIAGQDLTVEIMVLDAHGRPQPTGKFEMLQADAIVLALGQETDSGFLRTLPGIEVLADGAVKVDSDMMTGHPGIFAGGDMIVGERTVTVSAGHGKRAARHIDAWLRGVRYQPAMKHPLVSFAMLQLPVYSDADPAAHREFSLAERVGGFEEVVAGLSEKEARREAQRCLSCGTRTVRHSNSERRTMTLFVDTAGDREDAFRRRPNITGPGRKEGLFCLRGRTVTGVPIPGTPA